MPRVLALLLALAGCAAPEPAPPAAAECPTGMQRAVLAEVYFGRSGTAAAPRVTEADWARFLAEIVTRQFPDGLTSLDATGQWRGGEAAPIARERSKLLLLVLPGETLAGARDRLAPVTEAYRRRFAQRSVLVALRGGCAAF